MDHALRSKVLESLIYFFFPLFSPSFCSLINSVSLSLTPVPYYNVPFPNFYLNCASVKNIEVLDKDLGLGLVSRWVRLDMLLLGSTKPDAVQVSLHQQPRLRRVRLKLSVPTNCCAWQATHMPCARLPRSSSLHALELHLPTLSQQLAFLHKLLFVISIIPKERIRSFLANLLIMKEIESWE